MKKIVLLLILVSLVNFALAVYPYGRRYTSWQADEDPSITTGDQITMAVEWTHGPLALAEFGYGTSTNGSGWTWLNQDIISGVICSTVVQFNTQGTYYYAFRIIYFSSVYYSLGYDYQEASPTLSAENIVTVSDAPLPICLTSFIANANNGKVVLEWTTSSETENSHFLVYRDDVVIGRVAGNGTCTDPHNYTFVDDKVTPGVHEYAIEDLTYGGEAVMHDKVEVTVEGRELSVEEFILNKAYPNPFNPSITINYQLSTINEVRAYVYDTKGKLVEELLNTEMSAGNHTLTWDASGMPSGVYLVSMQAGNTVQSQKIVLMK